MTHLLKIVCTFIGWFENENIYKIYSYLLSVLEMLSLKDMSVETDTTAFFTFMVMCSIAGCVLNAITLAVYLKWKRIYSPRQTILKILTIVDLFISIIIMPCTIVVQFAEVLHAEIRLFLSFLKLSFLFSSSLILFIVAAQRFSAVHFPTRAQTDFNTYASVGIVTCFSFIVNAPVVYFKTPSKSNAVGLTGPEFVSLAVFLGGVILMMFLYFNIFNTLKKRASKRQNSTESRIHSHTPQTGSVQIISVIPYNGERKLLTYSTQEESRKPKRHSICLPVSKKSRCVLNSKVAPLKPAMSPNVRSNSLTPVDNSSFNAMRSPSPSHRLRRSTEEIANRKIALLMCMNTITFAVTWLPYWIAIAGLSNSVTLKHLFFLNQVINPIVYSLANKRFLCHLKTFFTIKNWTKCLNSN